MSAVTTATLRRHLDAILTATPDERPEHASAYLDALRKAPGMVRAWRWVADLGRYSAGERRVLRKAVAGESQERRAWGRRYR